MNVGSKFISLEEYFSIKGINRVDGAWKKWEAKDLSEGDLENQLYLICKFHAASLGNIENVRERIQDNAGRVVEQYKVNIRKIKRYISKIKEVEPCNEFENLIMIKGDDYIDRANRCIKKVHQCNYIKLLMRSMKRKEICLGDTSFDNLREGKERIEVRSLKKCGYNMVEMDCFYILSKYKRKNVNTNWKELASKFCEFEGLDEDSYGYILALLSYPYEFMKLCNRYRTSKYEWTDEEYVQKLKKSICRDGESLI